MTTVPPPEVCQEPGATGSTIQRHEHEAAPCVVDGPLALQGRPGRVPKALHHLGFACRDVEEGLEWVGRLYEITCVGEIVYDELQQTTVCMVETENGVRVELVAGPRVEGLVRQGVSLYHTAFTVPDLDRAIEELKGAGATLVTSPRPAVLFGGRRVAFLSTVLGLFELIESLPSGAAEPAVSLRPPVPTTSTIMVAATFTAEPLGGVLEFWLGELGEDARVAFAPGGHLFSQILDERGALARNPVGRNVVFVRMCDLIPEAPASDSGAQAVASDLIRAVQTAARRNPAPWVVCLCPSPEPGDPRRAEALREEEERIVAELSREGNVYVIPHWKLLDLYPVERWADPVGDALGRIPYSREFFAAAGTAVARTLYSLGAPVRKVIVVDCDNVLWTGVCAEDGAEHVVIDRHRLEMQRLLLDRYANGMLLCMCSKNAEADVLAVLDRPEMLLRREHFASYRINWKPKHENLRDLAEELGFLHESLVFIDDSPIECAEVRDQLPAIVVVQVPAEADAASRHLRHTWALDTHTPTREDEERNRMRRDEVRRREAVHEAFSFEDFYSQLGLTVEMEPLSAETLARAAQLTRRTNQFNFTLLRRTEAQLAEFASQDRYLCRIVRVSDRFGDYGLVGLVIVVVEPPLACMDTFLLSCRALGRGVEHRMLAGIAREARSAGCDTLEFSYVSSARNAPARAFLAEVLPPGAAMTESTVRIPLEHAGAVVFQPGRNDLH